MVDVLLSYCGGDRGRELPRDLNKLPTNCQFAPPFRRRQNFVL